tara:strand:- start:7369 stop:8166 length:798 start_codon:yes stop_codon:yes gene_type:complete
MSRRDENYCTWKGKDIRDLDNFRLFEKEKQAQLDKKKDSLSFSFFEEIRNEELGQYDIIRKLRDITNNYDKELLLALKKDVTLYLSLYKEKEEYSYSNETIEMAVRNREQEGLEIPYKKPLKGKLKDLNSRLNQEKNIDLEKLLFPHEFTSIYKIQKMIEDKIQEENTSYEAENKIFNSKYNWNIKSIEVAELCKALWETKRLIPKGMTQTELYKEIAAFFNTEVNYVNSTNQNLAKKDENPLLNEMSNNLTRWRKMIQEKNPDK